MNRTASRHPSNLLLQCERACYGLISSGMSDSNVTIALVNYNSGGLINQCVASLLDCAGGYDIVVVDNASTDGSVVVLEQRFVNEPTVTVIRNDTNQGFSKAVNQALSEATSTYLLLLNPDCLVPQGSVEALVAALQHHPEAGVAGGLVLNMDGSEQRGARRQEPTPLRSLGRLIHPLAKRLGFHTNVVDLNHLPMPDGSQTVDAVSGAYLMVRRDIFEQLGGMDEGYFLHWEDFDFCRRVREQGAKVLFHPDAVVLHHKGASGEVSSHQIEVLKNRSMLRYFNKFYSGLTCLWLIPLLWLAAFARRVLISLAGSVRGKSLQPPPRALSDADINPLQLLNDKDCVVVTGATSQIGDFLLPRLQGGTQYVLAVTRGRRGGTWDQYTWWVKPELLPHLARLKSSEKLEWFHLAPI